MGLHFRENLILYKGIRKQALFSPYFLSLALFTLQPKSDSCRYCGGNLHCKSFLPYVHIFIQISWNL